MTDFDGFLDGLLSELKERLILEVERHVRVSAAGMLLKHVETFDKCMSGGARAWTERDAGIGLEDVKLLQTFCTTLQGQLHAQERRVDDLCRALDSRQDIYSSPCSEGRDAQLRSSVFPVDAVSTIVGSASEFQHAAGSSAERTCLHGVGEGQASCNLGVSGIESSLFVSETHESSTHRVFSTCVDISQKHPAAPPGMGEDDGSAPPRMAYEIPPYKAPPLQFQHAPEKLLVRTSSGGKAVVKAPPLGFSGPSTKFKSPPTNGAHKNPLPDPPPSVSLAGVPIPSVPAKPKKAPPPFPCGQHQC